MQGLGKAIRLNRLLKGRAHKALVVAFDHGGTLGPIPGTLDPQSQIRRFVEAGVDGVLLNPGLLRYC
ncbi:MAG: fructose-bisphosphate aldolase, partial [Bryobacterales bacterium]|nr:fructose-bisphosphate aldolase [Bryobacterales bacterium]